MGLFSRAVDRMVSEKVPHKRRRRMMNTFAGVDTLDVHISVAAQLKVSMEDHGADLSQYVKVITNEMIDGYLGSKYNTKLADIKLDPVTTTDGVRLTNRGGTVREPNNKSYLEFECYFIASEPMWVHLTPILPLLKTR